jgi:hypothetical protein
MRGLFWFQKMTEQINLVKFVSAAFDTYKSELSKFAPKKASTDESKVKQASIYLTDIAVSIFDDYIKSNPNHKEVLFNVIEYLLEDGRVQKALGLTGSDWNALADLPRFSNQSVFDEFASTLKDYDDLRDGAGMFCC